MSFAAGWHQCIKHLQPEAYATLGILLQHALQRLLQAIMAECLSCNLTLCGSCYCSFDVALLRLATWLQFALVSSCTICFMCHVLACAQTSHSNITAGHPGVQIDDMPHIQKWMKRIEERPAIQKAVDIPYKSFVKQYQNDPKKKQEMIDGAKKFMGSQK
jgi:glutathione S-transferase